MLRRRPLGMVGRAGVLWYPSRMAPAPISERLQAGALRAFAAGMRALGPVRASNLGGWVGRNVGPRLRRSRVADANLLAAMPEMDAPTRAGVVRAVWESLGRTMGELPFIAELKRTEAGPGWELEGEEHVRAVMGGQWMFVAGHLGNWEMMLPAAAQYGVPSSGFYRAPSNRAVDRFMLELRLRAIGPHATMFAKGSDGARAAMKHMAKGGSLGLLVDQKLNDGVAVPFFGRPAMTATAMAQLALRYKCVVLPARMVRIGPARFRLVVEGPLTVPLTGDRHADVYALTLAMNQVLERWIREDPGAWLWLHRRWPKEAG